MTEIKRTPFTQINEQLGAKMVNFAGYRMPIQYRSIQQEHLRVRNTVGAFDLSHMGEFFLRGEGTLDFIQRMTTNDASQLAEWQIQYSAMCYPDGGIVDDLLVYRMPEGFMLVVNAANLQKDFDWLAEHKPESVELLNQSDEIGLLAIQGPQAEAVMAKLTDYDLGKIAFYHAACSDICGKKTVFSRTGYTGEDGFEIYCDPAIAEELWNQTIEAGQEFDIEPIGLGARDSLRLEVRYMLYGNDIDKTTNPIEAGLGWICKPDKGDFIGRDAIVRMKEEKPPRKMQALVLEEKAIPRQGYKLFVGNEEVGHVTSGAFSPVLEKGIAMGYVAREHAKVGKEVEIEIRGKRVSAEQIKGPFYTQGSRK